jgi:hypothetical protein
MVAISRTIAVLTVATTRLVYSAFRKFDRRLKRTSV